MTATAKPTVDTRENVAFLQRRLALFGKVLTIVFAVGFSGQAIMLLAFDHAEYLLRPSHVLGWVGMLIALGAWLSCRRGVRSRRFIYAVEAATLVGCAVATVVMGRYLNEAVFRSSNPDLNIKQMSAVDFAALADMTQTYVTMTLVMGMLLMFALRAAVVPSSARRTLVLALLVAIPLVVCNGIGWPAMEVDSFLREGSGPNISLKLAGGIAVWWTLATLICTVTSRVIYRLRREIRKAMQLGQYTLEQKLGEGGMGMVYRARHAMMRRPTAIKLLPPDKAGEASLVRFEREVQLTAQLTHPNTITIYDYGRTPEGVLYYAMELIDGVTLEAVVETDGPQPAARVLAVLTMVADALTEAHEIGLIHRDVKPANIMLCHQGGKHDVAKVLDFGLVKALTDTEEAELTHAGTLTGTPMYMSPEAMTDPDRIDGRSDIYAVGAVAYYLLVGEPVFDGKTVVQICSHHLHSEPVAPSERLGKPVDPGLEKLILECLAKSPQDRPQTAEQLRKRCEACRNVPPWQRGDADAWWEQHREAVCSRRPARRSKTGHSTVAVDLARQRD